MLEAEAIRSHCPADRQWTGSTVLQAALLALLAVGFMMALHPHLAVRDADGFAYIIGARSLHDGNGYRSLTGEALNHWPPGYSLLLSLFRDGIAAALFLNYFSLGLAVGLLYYLLRQSDWTWQAALSLCVVFASGFWRLLANNAHADIFTYAIFLLAIYLATQRRQLRALPSLLWAGLIPVKLIAAVFIPPALGADAIVSHENWKTLVRWYIPGAVAGALGITIIVVFNLATIHTIVPSSMAPPSLETLRDGGRLFIFSIPREFLFGWYSSVTSAFPRVAFPVSLLLAAICLMSLRPISGQRWFTVYGILCLVCSALLLCVRNYDPSVRLVGYGLIVLFLGFRPARWANVFWLMYGGTSLIVGVVNALTVDSLGSMDPRYGHLVAEIAPYYKQDHVVATNSFHILDLHGNIPSVPVTDYREAQQYDTFLWVTFPSFDPGATPVMAMEHPGPEWCESAHFAGAVLFVRCKS